MEIQKIRELEAFGLPFSFFFKLINWNEENLLDRLSLPFFLAQWKRHDSVHQQTNGDQLLLFAEFVQMQALLADIGATVGSTSDANPSELLLLSNITDRARQEELLQDAADAAEEVVSRYEDPDSECPRSVHHIVSALAYIEAPDDYPQFEDAPTLGDIGATEIDFTLVVDDWAPFAQRAFNIGIAIAKQYPDFCQGIGEIERLSKSNGYHQSGNEDFITPLKREFHLTQCHMWAEVCRPDLAHLLGSP